MKRIRELDALRGIWSILIFWFHAVDTRLLKGWSRVDLFFVLSGYLLTLSLIRTDKPRPSIGAFYARRLLRILPAYYLLLFIVVALDTRRSTPDHLTGLLCALTLNQNTPYYWSTAVPEYFPDYLIHTWFLAVELHFCLLWFPLICWLGRRAVVPLALWGLLNAVLLRMGGLHPWTFFARCDGLALGALLAVLLSDAERASRRSTHVALAIAAALAIGYVVYYSVTRTRPLRAFDHPLDDWESFALLATNIAYAALVGLIVCHSGHPALAPLRNRLVCYAGTISYGIYMYGLAIAGGAKACPLFETSPLPILAAFCLLIAAAAMSWEWIERPLLGAWAPRVSRALSPSVELRR